MKPIFPRTLLSLITRKKPEKSAGTIARMVRSHLLALHSYYLEKNWEMCAREILWVYAIMSSLQGKVTAEDVEAELLEILRPSEKQHYRRTMALIADFPNFVEDHASQNYVV